MSTTQPDGADLVGLASPFVGRVERAAVVEGAALAYTSDLMAGLDYVETTLRFDHAIASVNMSLGGSTTTAPCPWHPLEPGMAALRAAGQLARVR